MIKFEKKFNMALNKEIRKNINKDFFIIIFVTLFLKIFSFVVKKYQNIGTETVNNPPYSPGSLHKEAIRAAP